MASGGAQPPGGRLKDAGGESHTRPDPLIALVRLLARRAAEQDFARRAARPAPKNKGERL